ncbi:spermine oxidase-like [Pieris rapae]|uniref:spermine oxidase-like n=1 Tax=Pieris rapae TaxID=64459 RepID=UPI001E279FBC|nr:spermine oxidase-like [Pieris rapae]
MHTYDIIVVGLGCAGVSAATTLAKAGKKVLALEAMDRIGGRVRTVPFGDGVVEVGAEWIHGTANSSPYRTAMQHNIAIIPQDPTFKVYRSDGTETDDDLLLNDLVNFCFAIVGQKRIHFDGGMGEFITNRLLLYVKAKYPDLIKDKGFLQEFVGLMNAYISVHEASNDWNEVNVHSEYEDLKGHQHMSWHRYGYKTMLELMLNTYNNGPGLPHLDIKMNTEVSQIIWPKYGADVRVVCADGSTYTSRHVIVTVSLGVLKERYNTLFKPGLPREKVDAIEKTSIGTATKIIFKFDKAWWQGLETYHGFMWKAEDIAKLPKEDYWMTKIFGASKPMGSTNTLSLWASGEVGILLEKMPEDILKRKCMELLRKFMGKCYDIPEPTGMIRSTWNLNPFTRGSYSYDNRLTQNANNRRLLAQPLLDTVGVPRVLFAGEATDSHHFSTVHGAVDSGHREAMRLINNSKL